MEALMTDKGGLEKSGTELKWAEGELHQSFERLQRILEGTITALSTIVEKRDPYITGHH